MRFAQYSRLAAASFSRYSGVSHWARLALNCSEFRVVLSRSLRCASAAGSVIFSRLLSCAARMPSTLRFFISGSEFSVLWYSRRGFAGSSKRCRFASIISFRGAATPSPPSVKFANVPPSSMRLKCEINERSIAQASSQDIFTKRCTRTFSGPYFCTMRKHRELRSFFLIRAGFHRLGVLPMPT